MSVTPDIPFRLLLRVFGRVERVMAAYFAPFGISGSHWGVLRRLQRAETEEGERGLRLSDLGRRLFIRPPSVTGIVDRLERMGLVSREVESDDQRAKRVALTDRGRRLVHRVLEVH